MVDVFISYSRDNQDVVRKLAEAVKREGYGIWWDDELPPHLAYGDVIAEKVGQAKAAIVVWSAAAAASEWVRAEADMARNQKKLIQTSIDDRMPPMPFNQLHFASLANWDGGDDHPGWRKVKESLVALCGAPGGGATVPAAAPPKPAASVPPPSPAPAPRPAVAAPSPRPAPGNSNRLLIAAIAISLLVIATVGVLALLRDREASQGAENQAAPAGPSAIAPQPLPVVAPPPPPAAEQFTMPATIRDADGYANVRSGPSAEAPIVARVNSGETVMTYPQDGGWWRVRIGGGLVGYVEESRVRPIVMIAPPPMVTAPPATAPGPPQVAQRPRPQEQRPPRRPAGPRINDANAGVMREYCKGPGAGTPPCRRFEGGGRRR